MNFWTWFSRMREPSRYILTRCAFLTCALLCSSLIVLFPAGAPSAANSLLYDYAAYTTLMALVVLAAGGVGSALMEDILDKR